jgi:hypothetical protein
MAATNTQVWIQSTAYFAIQRVTELHQTQATQMDVINMGVMDCTVSIVDLQARERPQTLVIQINVTKDKTELSLCMGY